MRKDMKSMNSDHASQSISAIASENSFLIALRVDGTVVSAGSYVTNECCIDKWSNILSIDVGSWILLLGSAMVL